MKKIILILALIYVQPGYAMEERQRPVDGYDVMFDAWIVRPITFVGTVAGSALYIGLSPLTAIASIPAPHDAFVKLADTIVVRPFKYTFVRPIGNYDYREGL